MFPGGPVLGREVEFAGDLDVQGAAPPEVVDEEIELTHRLLVLLKLDAVGAQPEVRRRVEPRGDQGFEVLAEQLALGVEDARRQRVFAHNKAGGPIVEEGQVRLEGVGEPHVV